MKEWVEDLPGYPPIRMKQYRFKGNIGDFLDAVASLSGWRSPRTDVQVGFMHPDPDPRLKNYVPLPTQVTWLVRMFPIPPSTGLATIGVIELRAIGQTQLTFQDGLWARMREATSMGIVFDEIVEAFRELLPDIDAPNRPATVVTWEREERGPTIVADNDIETNSNVQPDEAVGGRPRNADDDWAWQQVNESKRLPVDVYPEWLNRIGARAAMLANPNDSFKKVIRRARGKKGKKGE